MSYSDVYTLVHKYPGINAPLICLWLNEGWIRPTHPEPSEELASWLAEHYPRYWDEACKVIDRLVDEGKIAFMDDGKIYPAGYTGEIFV
jgi:hypothetical protein